MPSPTLTKEQVVERLHAVREPILALGVRRVALFGSFVREEPRPDSDVDVLVEFDPVLQRRVELVTTEALSPFIGPHILHEAEDVVRAA